MRSKPIHRRWWFWPAILLLAVLLCEAALFAAVAINARRLDAPAPADAIIVLGARIYADGSPSPALLRRLDRAYGLYMDGYAKVVITTGAQGRDETMPEADGMKAYLAARGIPEAAILTDPNSFNTQENLENAKALMDAHGLRTAIIVSSDYHLWRALSMAGRIGLDATGAGSQNALTWPVALRNLLQETVSWVKYVLTR